MSLHKLYQSVTFTAERAYQQKDTKDVQYMAAAALQLAQAYQLMKDVELHEKLHADQLPGFGLPGEDPIPGLGN